MDGSKDNLLVGANIGSYAITLANANIEAAQNQWIHLLPSGQFLARDGRGPWSINNSEEVIAASNNYAGSKPIPVDYEHQTDLAAQNGKPAPAAGWIKQLQARNDGIWGLVEWTDKALSYLTAKEYRYLSPVFNHTPSGQITRILRAALTNNPALELTALASAQPVNDPLVELRTLLSLAVDADMQAITEAVKKLTETSSATIQNSNDFTSVELLKAREEVQQFKQQAEEVTIASTVDRLIETGHILPMHKTIALDLCRTDKDKFDTFVASISPLLKPLRGMQTAGLSPEQRGCFATGAQLGEDEIAICRSLNLSPEQYTQSGKNHVN